jgi:scyllo-inositol 2-dehydrogenase (NADP+)
MAIRTAIIGYGLGGSVFHEPLLSANPSYEVSAIVTSSPDRLAKAAQNHRVFAAADELWAHAGEFDLAVVTSPTAFHTKHALAALDAGLHVIIDKPATVSSADARTLIRKAADHGRSLSVFQSRRWDAEILTARELIAAGYLGEIIRLELSFQPKVGALREGWRDATSTSAGGGVTFDLGSHLFDQAQHLLGPAVSIDGEVRWARGGAADDDLDAKLVHDNGAVSRIRCSWVADQALPRLHLVGTNASYTVGETDPQEQKLKRGDRPSATGFGHVNEKHWGRITLPDGTSAATPMVDGDYGAFYRGFARHLEHGDPVPVDPVDAVRTLELIEALLANQTQLLERSA